ncbi:hypothetical protein HMPREF1548_05658 [Clostridium sp. KLE 1755]|jgi:hypothetical protein|nr:hypothetical protein HMPREF1548_05658 [Clostridium sp. KLE 1755]
MPLSEALFFLANGKILICLGRLMICYESHRKLFYLKRGQYLRLQP